MIYGNGIEYIFFFLFVTFQDAFFLLITDAIDLQKNKERYCKVASIWFFFFFFSLIVKVGVANSYFGKQLPESVLVKFEVCVKHR